MITFKNLDNENEYTGICEKRFNVPARGTYLIQHCALKKSDKPEAMEAILNNSLVLASCYSELGKDTVMELKFLYKGKDTDYITFNHKFGEYNG